MIINILKKVLLNPKYAALATLVALLVVVFAVWLPNLHLITASLTSSGLTLGQKVSLLTALLGSIETNFTTLSRSLLITSAVLMGVQVALTIYYIRQTARLQQDMGISFIAMSFSLLGVGCASCGSVLLATLFSLGAMTNIMRLLPLKGQEFSILGLTILLFAIWHTMKKINQPILCEVRNKYRKKFNEKSAK